MARLLRVEDAAAYCGFSKHNFNKLRVNGGGPRFVRGGRHIRYDIQDLDAWINELPRFSQTSETPQYQRPAYVRAK